MHGSTTSTSRSAQPPSTTRLGPCPWCTPCLGLARGAAAGGSPQSLRWPAAPADRTASRTRPWAHGRQHPPANAGGRQASKAGTRLSQGPVPPRPRGADGTPLRASHCWPAGSQNLSQAQPSLCARLHSHGRSLTCASARPPWIGPWSGAPQGAERVSLAPPGTTPSQGEVC
jgi:hypothetical protein